MFAAEFHKRANHRPPLRFLWQTACDRGTIFDLAQTEIGNGREAMAKGQLRGNKEAKKPKADGPKGHVSAYEQSQVKSWQTIVLPKKKT